MLRFLTAVLLFSVGIAAFAQVRDFDMQTADGNAFSLDSIRMYRKTQYVDRYIYRDVVHQPKPKQFGIGLSAGYGVGKSGLSPMVAVTLNWNLWQW